MSAFSYHPIHQHSTEYQEHSTRTHESGGDEEIVPSSHLEPCCFRKWNIGRQKHQRKQRRDDDIDDLTGRFCQALRRLRYQAFGEFHWVYSKIAAKIRFFSGLPCGKKSFKNRNQNLLIFLKFSTKKTERRKYFLFLCFHTLS